jgi:hypothetical protein
MNKNKKKSHLGIFEVREGSVSSSTGQKSSWATVFPQEQFLHRRFQETGMKKMEDMGLTSSCLPHLLTTEGNE